MGRTIIAYNYLGSTIAERRYTTEITDVFEPVELVAAMRRSVFVYCNVQLIELPAVPTVSLVKRSRVSLVKAYV